MQYVFFKRKMDFTTLLSCQGMNFYYELDCVIHMKTGLN